jgi:CRISPR-associated protein Cas2
MADERLYIVAYDITDQKRWRRVFRIMKGYGQWLQLSVFQCRLTARRRADMATRLDREIKRDDDHIVIVDVGPADGVNLKVESLGKPFQSSKRQAIIV